MAAVLCKAPHYDVVREVVNPNQGHKLVEVASRHQLDPLNSSELVDNCSEITSSPVEMCLRKSSVSGTETQLGRGVIDTHWPRAKFLGSYNVRSVVALRRRTRIIWASGLR